MKKCILLIFTSLLLVSCTTYDDSESNTSTHTIIDWIDFVKINNTQYERVYSAVIVDQSFIEEELGEVTFHVSDNVSNPRYQIKNGDAAFLGKGTKLYEVKDSPYLIATKDSQQVNGYRLYAAETSELGRHYKNLDKSAIKKVEFHIASNQPQLLNTIEEQERIQDFLHILNSGETISSYHPNTSNGDPTRYSMVFYTNQPIAYQFQLAFDGDEWFWHPWDTEIVPKEIENFIK